VSLSASNYFTKTQLNRLAVPLFVAPQAYLQNAKHVPCKTIPIYVKNVFPVTLRLNLPAGVARRLICGLNRD